VAVDGDSEEMGWRGKRRRGQSLTSLQHGATAADAGRPSVSSLQPLKQQQETKAQYVNATPNRCRRRV